MNPEAKEYLNNLLTQNPGDLTVYDRGFLRARRIYLNDEQKRVFKSVLEEEVYIEDAEEVVEEKPKAKNTRGVVKEEVVEEPIVEETKDLA